MLEFSGAALDVGGVIYYDEPFELAWLQRHFERASKADSAVTLPVFLNLVEEFYRREDGAAAGAWNPPAWWDAGAAASWSEICGAWSELALEIPGAARSARLIAERFPTVVVANQPAECARVLERWGVAAAVRGVFLDSLAGVAKPDPALLGLGVARLGLPAREVVMVGNRVDHDVLPARALGCAAVFILGDHAYRTPPGVHPEIVAVYERLRGTRTAPPKPQEAVPVLSSLTEFADLIGV